MSKAVSSPTARLLQNSRLFSLPRPLPLPPLEGLSSTGLFRASDTATTAYPTHQAITTPKSSLSRGDFGLKRALPAKTTRNTSTPHVRVKAQDTYEHVTEFSSAADHTQTREKWLELGVPIVRERRKKDGEQSNGDKIRESIFEDYLDNTDPDAPTRVKTKQQQRGVQAMQPIERWKYTAPHIASMQEGEFQTWLEKTLRGRREEWREFLRREELEERLRNARTQARNEGRPLSAEQVEKIITTLSTDEEMTRVEKKLRDDHLLDKRESKLAKWIADFLDLPRHGTVANNPGATRALRLAVDDNVTDDHPLLTTAPNAGLSHLRTNAIMANHPIYGPQKSRTPVQARVVRTRFQSLGFNENNKALLGVGGFVATDAFSGTSSRDADKKPEADQMAEHLNPDLVGGNKMWVDPTYATVNEQGRVKLTVARADDEEAVAIKKGELEQIHHLHQMKAAGLSRSILGGRNRDSFARSRPVSPSIRERPRLEGFDAQIGGGASSARIGDEMKRLLEGEKSQLG